MIENKAPEFYDVFVSYSHKDAEWVWNWLVPRLKQAGLKVCTDRESFDIGVRAIMNMENAIIASQHTVLVLTPNWVNSQWTNFEALLTQEEDPASFLQRVLPILLQPCELPRRLARLTYANLTGELDPEFEFSRLLNALRGIRRLPISSSLSSGVPASHPKTEEPNGQIPFFNLFDKDWSDFIRKMAAFKQDHDEKTIKSFVDIEKQLNKILDAPRYPFYQTEPWRELCVLVRNFSNDEPTGIEKELHSQITENLIMLVRRSSDLVIGTQQWRKKKCLCELCLVIGDRDPSTLSQLEKANKELEELESAAREYYEILQQSIQGKDWGRRDDILDWFMENAPDCKNVLQMWSEHRGER